MSLPQADESGTDRVVRRAGPDLQVLAPEE
jgi:hypothetical protein